MRAQFLTAVGQPLVAADRRPPVPALSEMLRRVHAGAVCRTDLHVVDGELPEPKLPLVPGHEIVGTASVLRAHWISRTSPGGRWRTSSAYLDSSLPRSVLRQRKIATSRVSLCRFFGRHGFSFKKNRARQRAGARRRGRAARALAAGSARALIRARLVFIDETGTSTNMARTRGRSRRGTRLVGRVPHGHWKITTFIAGLRCGEITAPFVIDRPMNGAIFLDLCRAMPGARP